MFKNSKDTSNYISKEEVEKIFYKNVLRVYKEVLK